MNNAVLIDDRERASQSWTKVSVCRIHICLKMIGRFAREHPYLSAVVVWRPLKLPKYGFWIVKNGQFKNTIHLHHMEKKKSSNVAPKPQFLFS